MSVPGALVWKLRNPANQLCKCHPKSTNPPGHLLVSHQHLCSCFLDPLFISSLFHSSLVSPSPGSPHQHHFLFCLCFYSQNLFLWVPSILSTYLFIYLLIQKIFTEYQSCTRHCYRYWECSYEQTDRNLCPYRVAVWWGVSSHAHAHTHILFRVNMGSRCSVSTY